MTREVKFTVPGNVVAKPRMTQRDKWQQRASVVRYRAWSDLLRLMFAQAGGWPVVDGERLRLVRLDWVAYIGMPRSWSKRKTSERAGTLHASKPDRDNIDKSVLDSLFKNQVEDDCVVGEGLLRKEWVRGEGRLEITITFEE